MAAKKLFKQKFGKVYIPDNAEDGEEVKYKDVKALCDREWSFDETIREVFKTSDDLTLYVVDNLDWEFPETVIENIKNFD